MENEKRKKFLDSIKQQPLLARINFKQYEKKVEKEVNIKEHIKSFELNNEDGKLILNTVLSSGTSININPMLLIGALVKDTATDEQDVDVIKIESYTEDMKIFK